MEWIDNTDALAELCAHLRAQPFVAVDTEFHRERTYYAQLALVQVASTERVACIDPLADVDLSALDELMLDPDVLKVVHAGRQDLEIFFDRTERVPGPVFDTQVAASLLGRGDQLGYGALVEQVTGQRLQKVHGRTDWMRRPLDKAVLEYAAGDVTWLRDVYTSLDAELSKLGRRGWLDEEQAQLQAIETYRVDEDEAWRRVKGTGRLKGVECAVAQQLGAWREARAREVDRPRRRVLSDEAIVDLARQRPKEVRGMERMRSIDDGTRKRHGAALIARIAAGAQLPKEDWPSSLDKGSSGSIDAAVVDALGAVLQAQARDANISARMLCTKGDLERLAAGESGLPISSGWRAELAGNALLAFLGGQMQLEVQGKKLALIDKGD